MRLFTSDQLNGVQRTALCVRPWTGEKSVTDAVSAICRDVRDRRDEALREYSHRFDAAPVDSFRVTPAEADAARARVSSDLRAAIDRAARNIRTFHAAQLHSESPVETEPGVRCWRETRPIETVGLYIPAGSAPLPSTVLMLGIPALLAGCKRIVLCSPPKSDGEVDAAVLAAAAAIGLSEFYRVGGAQAIAAMAYGTESIPKVDKIFGPGSQYVTEAKRFVSSDPAGTAIDLLAGPSELLVIADENAEPGIIAADLLSQAEHDPQSQVVLVTTDERFAKNVISEAGIQLQRLQRKEIVLRALDNSFALVVQSLDEAVTFSNQYAPEHLIINTRSPEKLIAGIQHAGSVFLGSFSPVTAGDYASGTNHTLPTGGTARWTNGVTVESFQKTVTFQALTQEGLTRLTPTLVTLAEAEGLGAHASAVLARQTRTPAA
jgi:histidinol dehydrogenase